MYLVCREMRAKLETDVKVRLSSQFRREEKRREKLWDPP
jgi:hypothetical protein